MTSSQDDEEWDKSTSEIQSEDSDELFDTRPNRWRGPQQSWRTLTEEDRLTYNAFERLRNEDLSVHLYNAFALRQAPRLPPLESHKDDAAKQDVDAETGQPINSSWAPPKAWTAWPLRPHLLPPDDFMKQTNDADDAFTFRRVEREYPSKRLEEVVSAAILRSAKERFRQRNLVGAAAVQVTASIKDEPLSSDNELVSGLGDSDDEEQQDTDSDNSSNAAPQSRLLQPAVATNDDVSYELIQPSTRSILQKLDHVLKILHNTRMASAQNLFDPAASSSSEDEEDFYNEATPSRKSRSRSRATTSRGEVSTDDAHSRNISEMSSKDGGMNTTPAARKQSNRGRKPVLVPREGESEREFLIRRAKIQKKKLPVFSDGDDEGVKEEAAETAAESTGASSLRRGRRRRQSNRRERRPSATSHAEYWQQKRLERLHLRDWSHVLGAAALAGFSPKVIARATQRCANLFGQGMEMHTISDNIIASSTTTNANGMETKRYVPGEAVPDGSSESDDEDDSIEICQARSMSRHSSMALSRAVSPRTIETSGGESQQEDEQWQSPRKRQRRSHSLSAAIAQHYCPHRDCERAVKGFDRAYNLKRHIDLAHQGQQQVANNKTAQDEEMYGGVYRDGFLEPIRMRKGWRAEDTAVRARRTPQKKRLRDESVSES